MCVAETGRALHAHFLSCRRALQPFHATDSDVDVAATQVGAATPSGAVAEVVTARAAEVGVQASYLHALRE